MLAQHVRVTLETVAAGYTINRSTLCGGARTDACSSWRPKKVLSLKVTYFRYTHVATTLIHGRFSLYIYIAFSLLQSSVEGHTGDKSFAPESTVDSLVLELAHKMLQWLKVPRNENLAKEFAYSIMCQLRDCIPPYEWFKEVQSRCERMWTSFVAPLNTMYVSEWKMFLFQALGESGRPIFWQSVANSLFKTIIKDSFPVSTQATSVDYPLHVTQQELNALRFTAGYVPQAVSKKLLRSSKPRKGQLWLCVLDVLDDGDEEHTDSEEWLDMVDRGGLTRVNEMTFQVFLAMELQL